MKGYKNDYMDELAKHEHITFVNLINSNSKVTIIPTEMIAQAS